MKRSQSTVKGSDLKDYKAVIRIFNQDFHNSSRYKGKEGHTSSSALSAIGIASSRALKKEILTSYVYKRVRLNLQGVKSKRSKRFSGTA